MSSQMMRMITLDDVYDMYYEHQKLCEQSKIWIKCDFGTFTDAMKDQGFIIY
jgi:hypothetical protein